MPNGVLDTRALAAKLVSRKQRADRRDQDGRRRQGPKRFYRHLSMKTRQKILLMMHGP